MCARWPTVAMSKLLFWVWTKLLPLHGGDVMCFGVMCLWFDLLSSDVASCEVICGATPVLLCTTKYYSSTTLYYKVLLQYHSVLQSTTPVLLCTARRNKSHRPTSPNTAPATQNECHQWSASHVKAHFQCVEQVKSSSNLTKYCACHAKWMSSMICVTYESSFPMRGASQVTLHLTKYCACHAKWMSGMICVTYETSFPMRGASKVTQNQCHQWSASHMKAHFQCVEQVKSSSNLTKYCACHAKWMSSMICVTYESSFPMRGASQVTLHLTKYCACHAKWMSGMICVTYETSFPMRGASKVTQNQCHQWSASHMKRHFQCAEPVKSPSNLTKYCACHEILKVKICAENPWSASANRKTIRP